MKIVHFIVKTGLFLTNHIIPVVSCSYQSVKHRINLINDILKGLIITLIKSRALVYGGDVK